MGLVYLVFKERLTGVNKQQITGLYIEVNFIYLQCRRHGRVFISGINGTAEAADSWLIGFNSDINHYIEYEHVYQLIRRRLRKYLGVWISRRRREEDIPWKDRSLQILWNDSFNYTTF